MNDSKETKTIPTPTVLNVKLSDIFPEKFLCPVGYHKIRTTAEFRMQYDDVTKNGTTKPVGWSKEKIQQLKPECLPFVYYLCEKDTLQNVISYGNLCVVEQKKQRAMGSEQLAKYRSSFAEKYPELAKKHGEYFVVITTRLMGVREQKILSSSEKLEWVAENRTQVYPLLFVGTLEENLVTVEKLWDDLKKK
jgi:hypothetical protein